jgi:haloalkane dehalogenase
MLHGEPSWSYLYRKMIPVFVKNGYRAIAPDLIGFGKSDKPVTKSAYTYHRHIQWVKAFLLQLDLKGINLFCQDWGGMIGLRLVADETERFARVVAANTFLATGDVDPGKEFLKWQKYSQEVPVFDVGKVIDKATVTKLSPEVIAAYDAPFPDDRYKAGARIFPMLVPTHTNDPETGPNRKAWQVLGKLEIPFLTLFGDSDPIFKGVDKALQKMIPGAAGQPHTLIEGGGHFLQEDKGEEIAEKMVAFMKMKHVRS